MKSKIQHISDNIPINYMLQKSIAPSSISYSRDKMYIDDKCIKTYYISQYPNEADFKWLEQIANSYDDIITTIHIKDIDKNLILKQLEQGISTVTSILNRDNQNKAIEQSYAKKSLHDNELLLDLLTSNKEKLICISTTFLIKSNNEHDLIEKCQKFKNTLIGKGYIIRPLINFTNEIYENSSPSYVSNDNIFECTKQIVTVSSFIKGFLNSKPCYSDPNGYVFANTLDGQTIFLDDWKRGDGFTNGNICIFGVSGVGKSAFAKYHLCMEYAHEVKCLICDPEREFKEVTTNLGGTWINIGGKNGKINPLQITLQPNEDDEEFGDISSFTQHIQDFKTFISLLYHDITPLQTTILTDKLVNLYKEFYIDKNTDLTTLNNKDYPTLSDLYTYMKKGKEKNIDYQIVLSYIKELTESYGELWDCHTNVDFQDDLICFDTSTLQNSNVSVKSAQYFLILNIAWEIMSKDRTEKVRLYLDEAHLLIDPRVKDTMAKLKSIQKRCRKYESATTIITQQVTDFLFPEVALYGQALLDASAIKIVFGTAGKSLEDTIDALKLPPESADFLSKRERGKAILDLAGDLYKVEFKIPDFIFNRTGRAGR